jgi:hypothetical protein
MANEIVVLGKLKEMCKDQLDQYPTTLDIDEKILGGAGGLTFNESNC